MATVTGMNFPTWKRRFWMYLPELHIPTCFLEEAVLRSAKTDQVDRFKRRRFIFLEGADINSLFERFMSAPIAYSEPHPLADQLAPARAFADLIESDLALYSLVFASAFFRQPVSTWRADALEHFPIHWIPVGRRKCVKQ